MTRNLHIPPTHPAIKQAIELANGDPRSSRDLCTAAGVAHTCLGNWSAGGGATVAALEAVLNVLGYELRVEKITPQDCAPNGDPTPAVVRQTRKRSQNVNCGKLNELFD